MESSHVPLTKWALAFRLYAASNKGFSAHQLQRVLGLGSYRTAWFMAHRIREAMGPVAGEPPIGGKGKIVEADEMFLGKSPKTKRQPGKKAVAVLGLVERGGRTRSVKLDAANRAEILPAIYKHVHPESALHTDGAQHYEFLPEAVASHEAVNHSVKQYVRTTKKGVKVHTNTLEGFFSVFKRRLRS